VFFAKRHYGNLIKDDVSHTEGLIIFTSRESERRIWLGENRSIPIENIKMKLKQILVSMWTKIEILGVEVNEWIL
jgi:hypothetical protein